MNDELSLPCLIALRYDREAIHAVAQLHRLLIIDLIAIYIQQRVLYIHRKGHIRELWALALVLIQVHKRHFQAAHPNRLRVAVAVIGYRQLIFALRHLKRHIRRDLCINPGSQADITALKQLRVRKCDSSMSLQKLNGENLLVHSLHTDDITLC